MIVIYWGIGLDALAIAVGLTLCTLGYRWARQDGWEAGLLGGRADRAQNELAERHAARRTGRHESGTAPHTSLVRDQTASPDTPPAPRDETPPWETRTPAPGRAPLPSSGTIAIAVTRALGDPLETLEDVNRVRVNGIDPFLFAPQAAPDKNGAADTGTMTRLNLPATTGEMAAVTDQYIADMETEETAYRVGLALTAGGES